MIPSIPEALAVFKRGRWCVVAKITTFLGETDPVLAVVWRRQSGTSAAISMPQSVLNYAKRVGAKDFILRDDRRRVMYSCPLTVFERGRLGKDGERYVPMRWLTQVPWREWRYAKVVQKLTTTDENVNSLQLRLLSE